MRTERDFYAGSLGFFARLLIWATRHSRIEPEAARPAATAGEAKATPTRLAA